MEFSISWWWIRTGNSLEYSLIAWYTNQFWENACKPQFHTVIFAFKKNYISSRSWMMIWSLLLIQRRSIWFLLFMRCKDEIGNIHCYMKRRLFRNALGGKKNKLLTFEC